MVDNAWRTGAALEAHYRFLAWLVPTVEKLPRSHKFTIGDRIEGLALDVLEALVEAALVMKTWGSPAMMHQRCDHEGNDHSRGGSDLRQGARKPR